LIIRAVTNRNRNSLLSLVDALADFEKLKRPTPAARKRLLRDCCGKRKRFDAVLSYLDGRPVGYAITFKTYSSFLALPTLYLEDIFILPGHRKQGIGGKLFRHCYSRAKRMGCGRMEWVVLDWNKPAIRFYDRLGARQLKGWLPYRLTLSPRERSESL
jgi:GNAT superfamily N-acetyltransferase